MLTTGSTTNWAGNVAFSAARVHRPATVEEVQRLVASAQKVRALGSGHSFNRIADTSGDLIRLDGLPPAMEIDSRRSTVTVAAGLRYAEVAERLHAAGYALANMASLPHISVAGCCATGTHGSGSARQGLASSVAGLHIVGPEGEPVELRRENPDDRLDGTVIGLGALGIVTGVTLDIEPAYEVAQSVCTGLPMDRLAADVEAVFGAAYSVSVFTDWHAETAMVWLKQRTDRQEPGTDALRRLGAREADRPFHPIAGMPPEFCTEQLGVPGPWHRRLPHFRQDFTPSTGEELQSEHLLPRTAAPAAFDALRRLGPRIAPVLQTSEIRTVAGDDLWLSPCHGRDTVAVHCTWVKDTDAVTPVLAAMEEQLMPLGARPHWGKLTTVPQHHLPALYERSADFRQLLLDRDPAGKFRNAFVDGLFPGTA